MGPKTVIKYDEEEDLFIDDEIDEDGELEEDDEFSNDFDDEI